MDSARDTRGRCPVLFGRRAAERGRCRRGRLLSRTLIIGTGLAGLSAARTLGGGCTLLESEARPGGLIRTEVEAGFSFDWTGHWLHARDPQMRALVEGQWLAGNLVTVQRRALIHSEGVWTRFPYQFHTHGLSPQTIADCVIGFVEATVGEAGRALRERPLANAAEFIQRHLGEGFARHFMLPYNEKLFTVPCAELSPEWGGRFIPRPTLAQVVNGAVGSDDASAGYNATFWYPREGGIESLARGMLRELATMPVELRCGAKVESIDLRGRRLRLASGDELAYEGLVMTAPLSSAARMILDPPAAVQDAARRLRSISVTTVEIGAEDTGGTRFHWAYFPERRFPFYRVGSPSEVHAPLAPAGCRSFAVEFSHQGPVDHAALVESALAGLAACGLVDRARVRLARARTIPVAYVLFDHHHAAARAAVIDHFAAHGVQVAGRYGRWEYSSMEDALLSGRDAALALTRPSP